MVIFVVSKNKVLRSIGKDNSNLEKISRILSKRIRILAEPKDKSLEEMKIFVTTLVSPVKFNDIEKNDSEVTITAGREGRARLIGRARIRQKELAEILEQYFGVKTLKIA